MLTGYNRPAYAPRCPGCPECTPKPTMELVKLVREGTGASTADCMAALKAHRTVAQAVAHLLARGQA